MKLQRFFELELTVSQLEELKKLTAIAPFLDTELDNLTLGQLKKIGAELGPSTDEEQCIVMIELMITRRCRKCGCTDHDCHQCIEKTGEPCHWIEEDLCSACQPIITNL
jgi:hypothetical protein